MSQTKEIMLHVEGCAPKRMTISPLCRTLIVPIFSDDGYAEVGYVASGLRDEDGLEIWTSKAVCIKQCQLDSTRMFCVGCGRNMKEIVSIETNEAGAEEA